jgi:hypothetical protein
VKKYIVQDANGAETLKVLGGSVGMASFSLRELAERSGVSPRTVATVVDRYSSCFEKTGSDAPVRAGRPAKRFRLKDSAIDEIVETVSGLGESLRSLGVAQLSSSTEDVEAALTSAQSYVLAIDPENNVATRDLLAATRSALSVAQAATAGGSAFSPEFGRIDKQARLISTVANLVEAEWQRNTAAIDVRQTEAFAVIDDTRDEVVASSWVPLTVRAITAPGTVLAGTLTALDDQSEVLLTGLFPELIRTEMVPPLCRECPSLADPRVQHAEWNEPVLVVSVQNLSTDQARDQLERTFREVVRGASDRAKSVVIADQLDSGLNRSVQSLGASSVVSGDSMDTQRQLTSLFNRLHFGVG